MLLLVREDVRYRKQSEEKENRLQTIRSAGKDGPRRRTLLGGAGSGGAGRGGRSDGTAAGAKSPKNYMRTRHTI